MGSLDLGRWGCSFAELPASVRLAARGRLEAAGGRVVLYRGGGVVVDVSLLDGAGVTDVRRVGCELGLAPGVLSFGPGGARLVFQLGEVA